MARKKNKRKSRRRFTGINLWNVGESYLQAAIWSQALFNVNPVEFVMSSSRRGMGGSSQEITLKELIDSAMGGAGGVYGPTATNLGIENANAFGMVGHNFKNSWFDATIKSAGLNVGMRLAKKVLSRPRREANKAIKAVGLQTAIKV